MSLSRLVILILVLAAAAFTLVSCATMCRQQALVSGVHTKYSPIVDVYILGDRAVPNYEPVPIHARAGKGHDGKPLPSVINWFGPAGETLRIEMKDPSQSCLRKEGPKCDGDHCIALTNIDFKDPTPARCDYRVWIEGKTKPYDPIVIIDNCCDIVDPSGGG